MGSRLALAAMLVALSGCAGSVESAANAQPSGGPRSRVGWLTASQAVAKFGDVTADGIAPSDRDAYFTFLTDRRFRDLWHKTHPAPQPDAASEPGARVSSVDVDAVLGLLDLARVVRARDPVLVASVRKALLHEAYAFAATYARIGERKSPSPRPDAEPAARSPWSRAEAAWIAWLNHELPTLTSSERFELARIVLLPSSPGDGAFPGLDRAALGFLIADEWARAGYPEPTRTSDGREATFGEVLCVFESRGRSSARPCSQAWYDSLRADARGLHAGLDARRNAKIEDLVLAKLGGQTAGGAAGVRAFLGDWPRWERAFDRALEAANRDGAYSDLKGPLVYEARAAWQAARGDQRGRVLLRIARIDYPHHYDGVQFVDWSHFEEWFGGRASAADFAGFLDADPKAWTMTGYVWPALGRDWSRSEVIVPRLLAHLGNPDDADESHSLGGISWKLCEEGRTAEMADIARVVRPLAEANPGTRFIGMAKAFADVRRCGRAGRS